MSNLLSLQNSKNQVGIGTNIINVNSNLTIKENTIRYIVCNTNNNSLEVHKTIEFEGETTLSTVKTHNISSAKLLYIASNSIISSLSFSANKYLKISNTGGLVLIDKNVPIVQSISATDGTYGFTSPNNIINITVNFNETVSITGTPSLTLSNGASASYISGDNSTSILFRYTIQQSNTDSSSLSVSSLSGTIEDLSGNPCTSISGTLGSVVVDTTITTVSNVTSSTTNGSYKAEDTISIQVVFSKTVIVIGTPQLTLETGTNDADVNYASGSGSNTLTFTYTVASGHTSSVLDYKATDSLSLNGGTIRDVAGNSTALTLPSPGATGSLGANKAIIIDTTAPSVVSFIISDTSLKVGETATVTLQFSESVSGFNSDDNITEQNGSLATMETSDNITWTGTFTPTDDIEDTTNILQLVTSYTDSVGNTGPTAHTSNYSIDTKEPTISDITTSAFSWGTTLNSTEDNSNGTVTVTTTGVEDNQTLTLKLYLNSNNSLISTQTGTITSNSTAVTITSITLGGLTDSATYYFKANVSDAAGNAAIQKTSSNFTVDKSASISISSFSWGTTLEYGEDSSSGYITVITNGIENGQVITLSLNSSNYTGSVSGSSNNITISAAGLQGLSNGNHTLTANVSDVAGNTATQTATVAVSKIWTLSSWLDTSEQYKIFAVGSSGMTQKTSGGKRMTESSNESNWSSSSNIGAGLLDSSTRSSHLNSNTAATKSGAGYGIQWVRGGPYWLAGSLYGLAYFSHDSYSVSPYRQGSHIPETNPNYSTVTTQYDGTNDYDSVFNLVKGSQSDAYRFETYAIRDGYYANQHNVTSSKNIFLSVSGYGGVMQTGSGHPYGDFNKIELAPQWKGGSPTGPSTLTVNTGGSDITYECVCVTIKGDYDTTHSAGANLADDSDMKNIFWHETSWGSGDRILMYTGVDTAGHIGYGGGNYWTWINRYFGGTQRTGVANSTTLATNEFWICKIP